jgi:hypothetical protein
MEPIRKVYLGVASTTVAFACLAAFSSASEFLRYIFIAVVVVLQMDFFRQLSYHLAGENSDQENSKQP